ncbi:MAG: BrnT family toxin [Candidatus Poribacteria bacterium]
MPRELIPFPASPDVVDKLKVKHHIEWEEIEEVFKGRPRLFRFLKANQYGEPRYYAWGRTYAGRYLTVIYVPASPNRAKVITARNMDDRERKRYRRE